MSKHTVKSAGMGANATRQGRVRTARGVLPSGIQLKATVGWFAGGWALAGLVVATAPLRGTYYGSAEQTLALASHVAVEAAWIALVWWLACLAYNALMRLCDARG